MATLEASKTFDKANYYALYINLIATDVPVFDKCDN